MVDSWISNSASAGPAQAATASIAAAVRPICPVARPPTSILHGEGDPEGRIGAGPGQAEQHADAENPLASAAALPFREIGSRAVVRRQIEAGSQDVRLRLERPGIGQVLDLAEAQHGESP